ncbi:hypothetical protein K2173_006003 [Erythroxylum novogranatense]|uniref:RING-type E3 ubiquitin transferase n=1 Tax=Erythroxylum novogranatense TaxID=1862640 RepID=A0AAV8TC92_9ROSI|nr:hypothetical protein K2173_006003 [Erythroxylum novogranatense]
MAFSNLISFFYSFMGLIQQPQNKDGTSYKMITLEVLEDVKEGESFHSASGSSSAERLQAGDELCCVCLSRLKMGQETKMLPCLHRFHTLCINRWLSKCRKTCPVCRFSMGEEAKYCKSEEQLTEEMVIWFSSFHVAGF